MLRRTLLRRTLAGSAALALPAFAQARSLVIGQSVALTGPAAQLGIQMNAGAKLWFDQFNASGGINGQPIELRVADDGYEPDRCKANTEKFIKDDAFALLGYVGTPTCAAALPLINEEKIPFFGPFTGAEILREPFSKSIFHLRASYYDETELIVKQLTSLGLNRIAVFYQNDAYGKAGFGGTFYNVSFVRTKALADELGPEARGVIVSQVMPYPFAPSAPLAAEYLAAGKAATGDKFEPNYSSIEGFVAAKTLGEALRRGPATPTPEGLIAGMESLRDVNLGGFHVDFGPTKRAGSRYVDLTMLTADGKVRR